MQNPYTKDKEKELDQGGDTQSFIKQGEDRIRHVVADVEKKVKQGEEQLKHVIADVDKKLHENPWPIVAGVAISCLLLGFIMGGTKRQS